MHCNVIPAFPSPVIQVIVDDDTSELLKHDEYNVSTQQVDNYEHSGSNERVLEKYPKTKNILLDAFTTVAKEVLGYKKRKYAITTSWITRTNRGEGSQLHRHKNSFWSCVYYYQKEYLEGTGQILFNNPIIMSLLSLYLLFIISTHFWSPVSAAIAAFCPMEFAQEVAWPCNLLIARIISVFPSV